MIEARRVLPALLTPGIVLALFLGLGACTSFDNQVTFTDSVIIDVGTELREVSASELNTGREGYVHFCYACHGLDGDGKGPSARYLRPPPRDFRTALFKFGGVIEGLPHDEDLVRIITHGLDGTAMLEWDIPPELLDLILQYIKTLAPDEDEDGNPDAWYDPELGADETVLGKRVDVTTNPWKADETQQAIDRGEKLYHGFSTCFECHAAYASKQEIFDWSVELRNIRIGNFNDDLYDVKARPSDKYQVEEGGETLNLTILPPDFLFNKVRSGTTLEELYRVIVAGVIGLMPVWDPNVFPEKEKDAWAIAYYVKSLIDMQGSLEAAQLRDELQAEAKNAFVPPPAPAPPAAPEGAEPAATEGAEPAATEGAEPAATEGAEPAADGVEAAKDGTGGAPAADDAAANP